MAENETTETTEAPAETPTPAAPEQPNPLQAKLDELQAKYDADIVARDKAIEASKSQLDEMQRRYEIAVKTGTKTPPQNTPESNSPVGDWVAKRYGK